MRALRDELVVHQVRVAGEHSIDLRHLAGTQFLVRIEAPPAGEQALAPQHFVDAGNASGEIVRGIEQRGVQIGELGAEREQPLNLSGRRRITVGDGMHIFGTTRVCALRCLKCSSIGWSVGKSIRPVIL